MSPCYTLEQLSALANCPRRTVRYYVQQGLMDRPQGETRAARYGERHLQRLQQIRQWRASGLSLEGMRQLLRSQHTGAAASPVPGRVQVLSHIWLAPGVELQIDPQQAGLPAERLQAFVRAVINQWRVHHAPGL